VLDVVLFEPEIPPNTGNIIRLCANTGAGLHLIEPLGFSLDDARLKRAGLDYHEYACVRTYPRLEDYLEAAGSRRIFALSTRGTRPYVEPEFAPGDTFLFGPETRGLPREILESLPASQRLTIPMRPGGRSLNLSNAVALVVYEAWRQLDFLGTGPRDSVS
jgi:tRNA (cytidine/uridine-2'-O-)-methyltransferase